jgi:GT2 family glycosyltransferase
VIVPGYNAARTWSLCLAPLLRQSYPRKALEIIVVDDGSTDNSTDLLAAMQLPDIVKTIHHHHNQGLAAARNSGIKAAIGELLVFLDADLEVTEDFVTQHVTRQQAEGAIGILGSTGPAPENPYDKYQRYLYEAQRGARHIPLGQPLPFQTFLFNNTSVKRAAIEAVGYFDEKITRYGAEDTELALRLWQQFPQGLCYAPEIRAVHHHYRSLEQVLGMLTEFGTETVPYLVTKHPELATLYGYAYLPRNRSGGVPGNPLKRLAGSLLRRHWFQSLLKIKYRLCPYPFSNLFVRIRMAAALMEGIFRKEGSQ